MLPVSRWDTNFSMGYAACVQPLGPYQPAEIDKIVTRILLYELPPRSSDQRRESVRPSGIQSRYCSSCYTVCEGKSIIASDI